MRFRIGITRFINKSLDDYTWESQDIVMSQLINRNVPTNDPEDAEPHFIHFFIFISATIFNVYI